MIHRLGTAKRLTVLIAALVFSGAVLVVIWWSMHAVPDPLYHGQRLSRILQQPARVWSAANGQTITSFSRHGYENAAAALSELGPRAVPLLVSWLQERDSNFKRGGRLLCNRLGLPAPDFF